MSRNVPMEPVICGECGATLRFRSAPAPLVPTPPDALREAALEYIDAIDADLHRPGNRWDAARRDAAMDALRAALTATERE